MNAFSSIKPKLLEGGLNQSLRNWIVSVLWYGLLVLTIPAIQRQWPAFYAEWWPALEGVLPTDFLLWTNIGRVYLGLCILVLLLFIGLGKRRRFVLLAFALTLYYAQSNFQHIGWDRLVIVVLGLAALGILYEAIRQNIPFFRECHRNKVPISRFLRRSLILWSPLLVFIYLGIMANNWLINTSTQFVYRAMPTIDEYCKVELPYAEQLIPCTGMSKEFAEGEQQGWQADVDFHIQNAFLTRQRIIIDELNCIDETAWENNAQLEKLFSDINPSDILQLDRAARDTQQRLLNNELLCANKLQGLASEARTTSVAYKKEDLDRRLKKEIQPHPYLMDIFLRKPKYYETLRTFVLDDKAYMIVRRADGIATWEYVPHINSWKMLSSATPALADKSGWGDPANYKTLRTFVIDDQAYLIARGNHGIHTWRFEKDKKSNQRHWQFFTKSPALSDKAGWGAPEHYETLQIFVVGKQAFLIARANKGIYTLKLDGKEWKPISKNNPPLSDKRGWGNRDYKMYRGLRTFVVDDKAYLLVRHDDGINTWELRSDKQKWVKLKTRIPALGPIDHGRSDWSQPRYYETLRTFVIGKQAYLIGRTPGGVQTWAFKNKRWQKIISNNPALADKSGWGDASNYETLRTFVVGHQAYLLARSNNGIATWRFTKQAWQLVASENPALSDKEGWKRPEHYKTLRTFVLGRKAYLLAIGPKKAGTWEIGSGNPEWLANQLGSILIEKEIAKRHRKIINYIVPLMDKNARDAVQQRSKETANYAALGAKPLCATSRMASFYDCSLSTGNNPIKSAGLLASTKESLQIWKQQRELAIERNFREAVVAVNNSAEQTGETLKDVDELVNNMFSKSIGKAPQLKKSSCGFLNVKCKTGNYVIDKLNAEIDTQWKKLNAQYVSAVSKAVGGMNKGINFADNKTADIVDLQIELLMSGREQSYIWLDKKVEELDVTVSKMSELSAVLATLVTFILILAVIKSFLYVLSTELFDSRELANIELDRGESIEGKFVAGSTMTIPRSFKRPLITKTVLDNQALRKVIAAWPFSAPFGRILKGCYFFFNKGSHRPQSTNPMSFSQAEGKSIVDWRMQEGEEVVFHYRNFFGASDNVKLKTTISLRLSTLLLGRFVFHSAYCSDGPGRLLLVTKGQVVKDQNTIDSTPLDRLLAYNKHTRFKVDSERTVRSVFMDGYTIVRAKEEGRPSGLILVEAISSKRSMLSGSLRFVKSMLLPF